MNIYSKLSDWQKRGLITAEQQQKITDYENNVRRPMLYHALLFLSCFCIGIGVIAVIAANWEAIPAAVKLGVDFALLCTAAWGVWHSRRKGRNLAAEALLTAFALLVLGSIGLVGQIYHLPAHGLSALLFWSVLTFPLLFLSRCFPVCGLLAFSCRCMTACLIIAGLPISLTGCLTAMLISVSGAACLPCWSFTACCKCCRIRPFKRLGGI